MFGKIKRWLFGNENLVCCSCNKVMDWSYVPIPTQKIIIKRLDKK